LHVRPSRDGFLWRRQTQAFALLEIANSVDRMLRAKRKESADSVRDLISICIPTYRRPSLLLHCLHSSFLQDYRSLEIDISDSSPADDTRTLVESLAIPEGITVRYWRILPATEPAENRRKLFLSARGRRIVWMNDDDVLLPGAVSAMSNGFLPAPYVIVAYGHEQIIDMAGEVMPEEMARSNIEYQRLSGWGLRRDFLVSAFWQQISHVGFLVLTEAARKIGICASPKLVLRWTLISLFVWRSHTEGPPMSF
jgi:GT2 family glycosyltransferase